jgi:ABC-type glycerol-3-phosphate transport system permease component
MSGVRRFTSAEATAYGFLMLTAVFCLLPFLWVMLASVDPNASYSWRCQKQ